MIIGTPASPPGQSPSRGRARQPERPRQRRNIGDLGAMPGRELYWQECGFSRGDSDKSSAQSSSAEATPPQESVPVAWTARRRGRVHASRLSGWFRLNAMPVKRGDRGRWAPISFRLLTAGQFVRPRAAAGAHRRRRGTIHPGVLLDPPVPARRGHADGRERVLQRGLAGPVGGVRLRIDAGRWRGRGDARPRMTHLVSDRDGRLTPHRRHRAPRRRLPGQISRSVKTAAGGCSGVAEVMDDLAE
jgi:hypothetical protein